MSNATKNPTNKTLAANTPSRRSRWLWGSLTVLILVIVGIYSTAEFYAPTWVKNHLEKDLSAYLKHDVRVGRVTTEAFDGILHLYDFQISDHGKPLVAFKEFHLDYSWLSLFSSTYLIQEATLIGPQIYVDIPAQGPMNLLALIPPSTPDNKDKKAPRWHISKIAIHDGFIDFKDERVTPARSAQITPWEFALADIGTDSANGNAELHGKLKGGGRIDWIGNIKLDPFRSAGHLKLEHLGLAELMRWAPEGSPIRISDGHVSVNLDYDSIIAPELSLHLKQSSIALDNLRVEAKDEPIATLNSLKVNGISVSYPAKQWHIDTVQISGGDFNARRDADGQMRLQKILAAQPKHQATIAKVRPTTKSKDPIWAGSLKQADIDNVNLQFNDASTQPATQLSLGPLSLKATPSISNGQDLLTVVLSAPLNTEGLLNLNALVGMPSLLSNGQSAEPFFKGRLQTTNINLNVLEAYVRQAAQVRLPSARLSIAGDINWRPSAQPVWSWRGDTRVDQLKVTDVRDSQTVISANNLLASGLLVQGSPNSVHLNNLVLDTLFARTTILADGSLNLSTLSNSAAGVATSKAATVALAAASKVAAAAAQGWPIHIDAITLKNGTVLFSDLRQKPAYSQAIRQLNGRLTNLELQSSQSSHIDLTGEIPPLGKLTVSGNAALFAPKPALDLNIKTQDIDLTGLSPYSGRFAGYRIEKGRVDTQLHYLIKSDQLNADNKVLLKEFSWGDAVDSADATSLPVRLAVALLKDGSGNIDIDMPLTGSLDDPQFRVWPLVWQTLGNLITRAAAAPFKLLGSLAGGGDEDISQINFALGSSDLSTISTTRLEKLATALKAKPGLQLEVRGLSDPDADKAALSKAQLAAGNKTVVTDLDVHRLAQSRANNIISTLSRNGVPSAQVFRLESGDSSASNGEVAVGLGIKLP